MAFYNRIPTKYMVLVPAIFFAAIGCMDIVTDALNHKLTIGDVLFNSMLFSPLILRHWITYIISGILACLFAIYGVLFLIGCTVKYFEGAHFRYEFETFVIGPLFAFATIIFGISLILAGRRIFRALPIRQNSN